MSDHECAALWRFDVRSAEALAAVRTAFVESLRRAAYPDARVRDAEVVLGELLANAARYAPGTIEVSLTWDDGQPVVLYRDRGPEFPLTTAPQLDLYAESGRGLYLVATLADAFAVTPRQGGGTEARVVLRA